MSCLGVHFSLSSDEVERLRAFDDESERLDHLREVIEEEYLENHVERTAESDKTWEAMHRALSDGQLSWDGGDYPLNHVVLAGELLYAQPDYIMTLKTPSQVRDVAAALPSVTESEFRRRYYAIDAGTYPSPLDEQDFAATWDSFQAVREFWLRAAEEGRWILFTADQ